MFGSSFTPVIAFIDLAPQTIIGASFFLAAFLILLLFYIMNKLRLISNLRRRNDTLISSLQKLDQQAKLILKNDMDIKLYQQEIIGPNDNLKLIRKFISSTSFLLSKEKLFSEISSELIKDFNFEKSLILDFQNFEKISESGFSPSEITLIKNTFSPKKHFFKTKELLTSDSEFCKAFAAKLNTKNLIIAPIKNKNKVYAIFFAAGLIDSNSIKNYIRESFLILCMYIAKCLENIELFEQIYKTKEGLESKIRTRTKELAVSLKRVETTSKAKSDFISSVSHELRTPLTSVMGFSSLLADEKFGKLPDEAKKRLNKVVDNVDKLMDIVNTLLDISRIESGKIEINIIPHNIASLIESVASFFEPQSQSKNIKISQEVPKNLEVYMDKNLIERVLINLLNNAIKFTPEGGKIKIACNEKEEKAVISIVDTGYGISEEDLIKIFQEFYRVKDMERKAIKGSGLGLSLVKRIIEGHKEKIWAESKLGQGTAFYFTLQKKNNEQAKNINR